MTFAVPPGTGEYRYSVYQPSFFNYPPLAAYLFWALGLVHSALDPMQTPDTRLAHAIFAAPAIACDLMLAALIALALRQVGGTIVPLAGAALVLLCPALIWDSSVWLQTDSLAALPVVASVYLLASGRVVAAAALCGLGLLIKPQVAFLLPVIAYAAWNAGSVATIAALAAGLSAIVVGSAPFLWRSGTRWLEVAYLDNAGVLPALSLNAYNPWWLVSLARGALLSWPSGPGPVHPSPTAWPSPLFSDRMPWILGLTPRAVGLVLFSAAFIVAARVCHKALLRDPARFYVLGTLTFLGAFLFLTEVHERYIIYALPIAVVTASRLRSGLIWLCALFVVGFVNLSGYSFFHLPLDLEEFSAGNWTTVTVLGAAACAALGAFVAPVVQLWRGFGPVPAPRQADDRSKRNAPSKSRRHGEADAVSASASRIEAISDSGILKPMLLLAIAAVVYLPAFRGGFIGLDDDAYVANNPNLESMSGLARIWLDPATSEQYYPLTFTSFWIEHQLWGDSAPGYHAVNVALHAVNVLLLWTVLRRLNVPAAWCAAALFAAHPVHVASVAWISERKNVLATFFSLLTVLAWLQLLVRTSGRNYALTLASFLAALLSKASATTLPLSLLLLAWWRKPEVSWRHLATLIAPLIALSGLSAIVTMWRETLLAIPDATVSQLSIVDRSLIAGRALWFYVGKLLWPGSLTAYYPRWDFDASTPAPYSFPIAAAAVVAALWLMRSRLGRGPLVAVLVFAITLAPTLGFVPFNFMSVSYVADHFQYPASAALIALGAAAAASLLRRVSAPAWVVPSLSAVLVLVLGTITWQHAGRYEDIETFARANIDANPLAAMPRYTLGTVLIHQGKIEEAVPHLAEAVRLRPDFADAHNSLGYALRSGGHRDAAREHFTTATRLGPHALAERNLGDLLREEGKVDAALEHYRTSVRIDPGKATNQHQLGTLLLQLGRIDEAIEALSAAVRLMPARADTHRDLGLALQRNGRASEAAEQYALALAHEPGDARVHAQLGGLLAAQGKLDEAAANFAEATRLDPTRADVHNNWGVVLAQQGKLDEAIGRFSEALRLRPDYDNARANLHRARAERDER